MGGPARLDGTARVPTGAGGPVAESAAAFRIAGHTVHVVGPPPPALAAVALGPREPVPVEPWTAGAESPVLAETVGWLGGKQRRITCRQAGDGVRLSVEGAGEYLVLAEGRMLAPVPPIAVDPMLYEEAILGPPLLLALALRGTFCLHASAVARGGEGLAILGDSGEGKSTLARWLAERKHGWTWLTDDITPVAVAATRIRVEPAFPQLKAPELLHEPPAALPLRGWVQLRRSEEPRPRIEALGARDRFVALMSSIAGARVFPPERASAAFDACGEISRRVPGHRLHYPRRWDALPEVSSLLAGWMRGAGAVEPS